MAGTIEGGKRAAQTNKLKYGKSFYKVIGRTGGSKKVRKGFAVSGLASIAGRKGGLASWANRQKKWWDIKNG